MIGQEAYILKSINRNRHFGSYLYPISINALLRGLQKYLKMDSDEQLLSDHSFRVGTELDFLTQSELVTINLL